MWVGNRGYVRRGWVSRAVRVGRGDAGNARSFVGKRRRRRLCVKQGPKSEAQRLRAVGKDVTGNVAAVFEAWWARCGEILRPTTHPKPSSQGQEEAVTGGKQTPIRKLRRPGELMPTTTLAHHRRTIPSPRMPRTPTFQ